MGLAERLGDPTLIDSEWLNSAVEEPIDPELPIVDPHHHNFWSRPVRYRIEDLLEDLETGHDVRATVHVEGGDVYRSGGPIHLRSVGETDFINGMAAVAASGASRSRICAGIVAAVDLTGESAAEAIDAHLAVAGERLRGVRVNAYVDEQGTMSQSPPRGLLYQSDFRKGFAALGERSLVCDLLCFYPQLGDVADLAASFPGTPIVLNHCGGPLPVAGPAGQDRKATAHWLAGMRRLAPFENVFVKLGGLTNPSIGGISFREQASPPTSEMLADAMRPYVEPIIGLFGPERCMFESNFPVDKPTASYVNLWNAFKRLAGSFDRSEQLLMLGGTAANAYSLGIL